MEEQEHPRRRATDQTGATVTATDRRRTCKASSGNEETSFEIGGDHGGLSCIPTSAFSRIIFWQIKTPNKLFPVALRPTEDDRKQRMALRRLPPYPLVLYQTIPAVIAKTTSKKKTTEDEPFRSLRMFRLLR